MGCDIHCTVEVYNKESNEWEMVTGKWGFYHGGSEEWALDIYDRRDYRLFGYLASVRDAAYDDMSDPRGYPDDCNPTSAKDVDDIDLHSHTYFTLTELLSWKLWWDKEVQENITWFYMTTIGQLMLLNEDPDNVRLLICFDN